MFSDPVNPVNPTAPPYGFVNMNSVSANPNGMVMNGVNDIFQAMNNLYPANAAAGPSTVPQAQTVPVPGSIASNAIDVDMLDNLVPLQNEKPNTVWNLTLSDVPTPPVGTTTPAMPLQAPREATPVSANPFESLGGSPAGPSRQPTLRQTTLRVVPAPANKIPVVPLATPAEVTRATAAGKMDSSSISLPVKRPAPTTTTTEPKKERKSFSEIMRFIEPQVIQMNKPSGLFKFFRIRKLEDGSEGQWFTPTPHELASILDALDKHASTSYLQLMADNAQYTEVLARWLKQFIAAPQQWEPAIAPLLLVLGRTDMAVNWIEDYHVAKRASRVVTKAEELKLHSLPAIKKGYARYSQHYENVLKPKDRRIRDDSDSDSDSDARSVKKRKTETKLPAKTEPKLSLGAKLASQKAAAKPSTAAKPSSAAGRTDMSFFNAPVAAKPKPKLPDFKKAAPAPGGSSLLASTMKKLKKEDSPPARAPPSAMDARPGVKPEVKPEAKAGPKLNKKGHTVRWVDSVPNPPRVFEAIKEFRQEAFEFELPPWQEPEVSIPLGSEEFDLTLQDGVHGLSSHQLDMDEGRHMHRHNDELEEEINWYEPYHYEASDRPPIIASAEAAAQEERERSILAATYLIGDIPFTPNDTGVRTVADGPNTRQMNTNPTLPPNMPGAPIVVPPSALPQQKLGELLRTLNLPPAAPAPVVPPPQPQYGAPSSYNSQAGYGQQGYQSQAPGYTPSVTAPQSGGRWGGQQHQQGWNNHHGNQARPPPTGPANGGGRWGGRGTPSRGGHSIATAHPHAAFRVRPCRFYQLGTCNAGDQCTFVHPEPGSGR